MTIKGHMNNSANSHEQLADIWGKFLQRKEAFTDELMDMQPGLDWDRLTHDPYDMSLEFYHVPDQARLTDAAQTFIMTHGFQCCWLNHDNGWETLYVWENAEPRKGWRKRQWREADGRQRIEVESFPDAWPQEWLTSEYVTICQEKQP